MSKTDIAGLWISSSSSITTGNGHGAAKRADNVAARSRSRAAYARRGGSSGKNRPFPSDRRRRLVLAQALIDDMAEKTVACPGQERHFGKLRSHPMDL
jgi:hypothetical protein